MLLKRARNLHEEHEMSYRQRGGFGLRDLHDFELPASYIDGITVDENAQAFLSLYTFLWHRLSLPVAFWRARV